MKSEFRGNRSDCFHCDSPHASRDILIRILSVRAAIDMFIYPTPTRKKRSEEGVTKVHETEESEGRNRKRSERGTRLHFLLRAGGEDGVGETAYTAQSHTNQMNQFCYTAEKKIHGCMRASSVCDGVRHV